MEGVDRNLNGLPPVFAPLGVALLVEGVDRNWMLLGIPQYPAVALLVEGVDRNTRMSSVASSRLSVALLVEGVDRNTAVAAAAVPQPRSPASWRARIEIERRSWQNRRSAVALLVEGVDRNQPFLGSQGGCLGRRPPRGGRG